MKFNRSNLESERGLSEVLAFSVLFSALIVSIMLVYTSGMGAMLEIQYGAQSNAGLQVMKVISEDVEEVYEQQTPSESVEMQLRQVSFGTDSGTEIMYRVENTDTGTVRNFTYTTKTLLYSPESKFQYRVPNTRFGYVSGALIRMDNARSVMVREPPYRFTPEGVYLTGVELRGVAGAGGSTHVTLTVDQLRHDLKYQATAEGRNIRVVVHIETSSTRARAWNHYLSEEGLTPTENNDVKSGVVEYEYMTDHITYKKSVLDVEVTG